MKTMPLFIVVIISKLSGYLVRLLGRGDGNALPGLIAERLRPNIVPELTRQLRQGVVLVTGTNGKTTTTQMVTAIVDQDHGRVVTNRAGSNLNRGVASALIGACDWRGRVRADLGIFELDEAVFAKVAPSLNPKVVVVLNLFRDQLDRYGELDTIATALKSALVATKGQVILNADDPLVASLGLGLGKRVHYFGVEQAGQTKLTQDQAADSENCPICGTLLKYTQRFYGHIGHYSCPTGDFKRPQLDLSASLRHGDIRGQTFEVSFGNDSMVIDLKLPGLYNLYNALAASAVGLELEVKSNQISARLSLFSAAFGRAESLEIDGKQIYLLLVKNPTGFNQVIQTFLLTQPKAPLLVMVNDQIADGRDVSWLWDVAFEAIAATKRPIIASGIRAADLSLRLKYAEIKSEIVVDLGAALDAFLSEIQPGGTAFILPTYTAMLEVRRDLATRVSLKGVNQ